MANFNKSRLYDLAILSVVAMLVQIGLSKFIYPLFKASTQQLFAITPQTAIGSSTIGTKIIAALSGIVSIDLGTWTNWLVMFLGVYALLIAGYFVYEQKFVWHGKDAYQRLWAILLYGTAALYAVLMLTNMAAVSVMGVPLLIGVGINYIAIAFVITTAAKYLKFLKI